MIDLALGELASEDRREPVVPALRHARGLADRRLLLRIEMDVEVLGLEHLPVEVLVLDLVAAEVLGGGALRQAGQREERRRRERTALRGRKERAIGPPLRLDVPASPAFKTECLELSWIY